jgi:hypothetical protein
MRLRPPPVFSLIFSLLMLFTVACDDPNPSAGGCPDGCVIDGVCWPAGARDPGNPCHACDPTAAADAWTDLDAVPCDDGLFCTVNDTCDAGVCAGGERACDDGVACNGVETCDEDDDACEPGVGPCGPHELCDVTEDACVLTCTGCAIAGSCYGADQVNPANPCQVCDPLLDPTGWTGRQGEPCDDGLFCTVNDRCNAGVCRGNARSCDDGIACNDLESCDEDYDTCLPGASVCQSDELCDVTIDACVLTCTGCAIAGLCYGADQLNPANSCQVCDPTVDDDAWTDLDAEPCDDGLFCTIQDACNAGVCEGGPRACDDGVSCNGAETCDEDADACEPGIGPCGPGELCDVTEDACVLTCTGCAIAGSCYGANQVNPANPCQMCLPLTNPTAWTPPAWSSCDDGIDCTYGDTCNLAGVCEGVALVCASDRPCKTPTGCVEDPFGENAGCPLEMHPGCAASAACAEVCETIGDTAHYFIHFVTPGPFDTSGGALLTLEGFFGDTAATDVTVHLDGLLLTLETVDATTITFLVPAGHADGELTVIGPGGTPVVLIGQTLVYGVPETTTSSTVPLRYLPPEIDQVSGCALVSYPGTANCSIWGGDTLTIHGRNFGDYDAALSVLVGDVPCADVTLSQIHEVITCTLPVNPEGGWDLPVTVSRLGKSGALAAAVSFSGPVVTGLSNHQELDPFGGDVLTVTAHNLGMDVSVRFGPTGTEHDCPVTTIVGDTVTCMMPPGNGRGHQVRVRSDSQWSRPAAQLLSYREPVIVANSLTLDPALPGGPRLDLTGYPVRVFIQVEDLHVLDDSVGVYLTDGPHTEPCASPQLTLDAFSNRFLSCWIFGNLASNGEPMGDARFLVTVPNGSSGPGADLIHFGAVPGNFALSGCVDDGLITGQCPTEGGDLIALTGENFSPSMQLLINGVSVPFECVSPELVRFLMPAGSGTAVLQVLLDSGALSATTTITYAAPSVTSVGGCLDTGDTTHGCPLPGGVWLTIRGGDFGPSGARVLVGGNPCTGVTHDATLPHRELRCLLPPGDGLEVPVVVLAGHQESAPARLSYQVH